jgi:hypothetical protein
LVAEENRKGNMPWGFQRWRTDLMPNVFIEKMPSVAKVVLVAGMVLFAMIRWA